MDELSPQMNQRNFEAVRALINRATSDQPHFANSQSVMGVVTDMDHHPYSRWYRGVYYFPDPIIMEREAGYREQKNNCYTPNPVYVPDKDPCTCFEPACSTIFPCYTSEKRRFKHLEEQNACTNNTCIVQHY